MDIKVIIISFLLLIIGAFSTIAVAWLAYKLEWKVLILLAPLMAVLFYFLNEGKDISLYLSPLVMGMIGGLTLRFKKSFLFYIITSTMLMLVFSSGSILYLKHYMNIDYIEVSKQEVLQVISTSDMPSEAKSDYMAMVETGYEFNKDKFVFSNFLSILFLSLFLYSFIKRFFYRFNEIVEEKGLEYFRLDDYFIFVLIFSWGTYLLVNINNSSNYNDLSIVALNIALIASVFYFIQAIGVIKFYVIKKGWPSYFIPMMFMMILILGGGGILFFSVLLAGFGSLDLWADFRKLNISTIENNVENNKENQE